MLLIGALQGLLVNVGGGGGGGGRGAWSIRSPAAGILKMQDVESPTHAGWPSSTSLLSLAGAEWVHVDGGCLLGTAAVKGGGRSGGRTMHSAQRPPRGPFWHATRAPLAPRTPPSQPPTIYLCAAVFDGVFVPNLTIGPPVVRGQLRWHGCAAAFSKRTHQLAGSHRCPATA